MNASITQRPMSHIPEEALHAYLDQALSRSRCVVIESHLAACPHCRATRDSIAALRDRTTLLLGRLAPERRIPPSLEELGRRQAAVAAASPLPRAHRRRILRIGGLAASLVGAIGLGYALRIPSGEVAASPLPAGPTVSTVETTAPGVELPVAVTPRQENHAVATHHRLEPVVTVATGGAPTIVPAAAPAVAPSATIEYSTDTLPRDADQALTGLWRTVQWDDVRVATGNEPTRVEGVPVEEVQLQASRRQGAGPVTLVAQRLSSGEVIQTIEGPAADVTQLLDRRGDGGLDSTGSAAQAMQRGDRMIVVTGELPPDSLRALVRRVNNAMRVR